jgi:hypothetical protein
VFSDSIVHIEGQLIQRGFMDGYSCYTKHGEELGMPLQSQGSCEREDLQRAKGARVFTWSPRFAKVTTTVS